MDRANFGVMGLGVMGRIRVTLATGISEERCRHINLGYLDPATINLEEWKGREAEGILYVPRAGEMLYRVKTRP